MSRDEMSIFLLKEEIEQDIFKLFERSDLVLLSTNGTNAPSRKVSTPLLSPTYNPTLAPTVLSKNSTTFTPSEVQNDNASSHSPSIERSTSSPIISNAPTIANSIESISLPISSAPTITLVQKSKPSKSSKGNKPTKSPELQTNKPPKEALQSNKPPRPSKSPEVPELSFVWGYTSTPSMSPTDKIEHSPNKLATVILPSVVVTGSIFMILMISFRFRRRHNLKSKPSIAVENDQNRINSTIIQINDTPDDISTLDGGIAKTVFTYDPDNSKELSFEPSLYSVDYDYTGVYNKGAQSISTAGATGLMTHKLHDDIIPYRKDSSFTDKVPSTNIITIEAPPGKLGILLADDQINPIVQHVKQDGFLWGKIQVGDKLLKVDEFDTCNMTTEHVCYVISSRSLHKRKLVFLSMNWL